MSCFTFRHLCSLFVPSTTARTDSGERCGRVWRDAQNQLPLGRAGESAHIRVPDCSHFLDPFLLEGSKCHDAHSLHELLTNGNCCSTYGRPTCREDAYTIGIVRTLPRALLRGECSSLLVGHSCGTPFVHQQSLSCSIASLAELWLQRANIYLGSHGTSGSALSKTSASPFGGDWRKAAAKHSANVAAIKGQCTWPGAAGNGMEIFIISGASPFDSGRIFIQRRGTAGWALS